MRYAAYLAGELLELFIRMLIDRANEWLDEEFVDDPWALQHSGARS